MASAQPLPIRIEMLFYRETDRAYAIAPHAHAIHQWYLLVHGGVDMQLEDRTLALRPGESVIIPPGMLRSPRCRDRAPGYLVAVFEATDLDLSGCVGEVLPTPAALAGEVAALVAELRQPQGPSSRHLCAALLTRLLIGLERAHVQGGVRPAGQRATPVRAPVAQAEAFMERNFWRPLRRQDISRAVGLSEVQLGRLMRSATGRSILQRLTDIRMEQASHLLRESDMAISQIALEVGISSFSHFASTFRRATGLTPSAFRRSRGRQWA